MVSQQAGEDKIPSSDSSAALSAITPGQQTCPTDAGPSSLPEGNRYELFPPLSVSDIADMDAEDNASVLPRGKLFTLILASWRGRKEGFSKIRSSSSNTLGSVETQTLRAAYKEQFLPRTYVDIYGNFTQEAYISGIKNIVGIFQSDLIQGQTLLDVGSGPMLLCSLVASSRFKHIVLSDLLERNRLELNKWLNNHEDAIDWTTPAETIAAFEGYNDVKKGASEIMERTRSAIRKVVPCDVLEPGVLPEEHKETFDVVLSSGCLDAVAADHESFRTVVCNVGTLVKPGGLLVITGAGGLKHYTVGAVDFAYSNLTEDVLKQAIRDAGFQIKLYRSTTFEVALQTSDLFKFILVARRA
ncbi:nicotinamide N-methyltransferase [Ixodes scapularis]|uniref:nicotinamide N-methyltransferase n=1 Tax=Ixodes scapularis TaxID=6945 RepID=UPI001A9D5F91|nr:nicotinamide N-methyltransferase [Ixodes scapularis]